MSKKGYPLIFIVEDNIAYSKVIEYQLKKNGFNSVFPFISGEECLKHIHLKPDIVIQDYKLQGMSGLHVLKQFKRKHPRCEFIFLSGQDDVETAVNTIKLGAFDYIVKTQTAMDQLMARINYLLSIQQSKRRRRNYRNIVLAFIIAVLILAGLLLISTRIFLY
jgi:DNA-binding NtrC family response regulator